MPLVLGVIPARYQSTRFPGKALAPLGDRSLVEEVWHRAKGAKKMDRLVIATDDRRIAEAASGFGAEVCMTSESHPSGTDRVAEVVGSLEEGYDLILSIQGDEPLLTPTSLDRLIVAFEDEPRPQMATLVEPIESAEELFDPNVVKVVANSEGRALYFSRSAIPYHRGQASALEPDFSDSLSRRPGGLDGYLKHQGIYAYTRESLRRVTLLPPSPLEVDEGLEQLRALEAGCFIQVVQSDFRSMSVDTPVDLERVTRFLLEAN